ncbi:phosphoribosyltransferase [Sphingomonas glacialis]|uniref:Phosphoribosyltransferase n=1 Tax=Sphingomonas glacialis TaxID=658225 RepID=A0A502FCW4_9SPHN|nr:phosphoribosyltransferase domain-containing protein [Sphingomonas glacialis]TPG47176.1 phosphoribosyltransferase [Sphingomonas glacialis]
MSPAASPELFYIAHDDFVADTLAVAQAVTRGAWMPDFVVGIGRGGLVPAVFLSHALNVHMLSIDHSSKVPGFAEELLSKVAAKSADGVRLLFVDDINDSGGTIADIRRLLADSGCDSTQVRFAVLLDNVRSQVRVDYHAKTIDRADDKRWFVFPWEAVGMSETIVEEAMSVPERLA